MATAEIKIQNTDTDQNPTPPKGSKKKLLIILVFLLALVGGGLVYYFKFSHLNQEGAASEKVKAVSNAPPIFLQMDPYTVNLKPDGQFLQATFTLQIETAEEVNKIKLYMPQIRSRLLLMLSNKTADELSTLEGKKILSQQIQALVEEPYQLGLVNTKIVNVLFTSFVIQ